MTAPGAKEELAREIARIAEEKKHARLGARAILMAFRDKHGAKEEFADIIVAINKYFASTKGAA